jgi:hypothetical protein
MKKQSGQGFIIRISYMMIFVIDSAPLYRHGCQAMLIIACLRSTAGAPGL